MKKINFTFKLALPFLILIFAAGLAYDLFKFYSSVSILYLDYLSELSMVLFGVIYYRLITTQLNIAEKPIRESLKFIVTYVGLLYAIVIILKLILNPTYNPSDFPQPPDSLSSVIYSNLISIVAIIFMVPVMMIIRQLVFYKRKRSTILLIHALFIVASLCIILTVILKEPLNFDFDGLGIYNNLLLVFTLSLIFLLSFRNSWITYLSRKEKMSYFFISLFLIWAILFLFDYAFAIAVASHSLAVGSFTNIAWFVMVFYTISCGFYLLLHLPTAKVFDRKMREVASLHNLSREVSAEFDFKRLVKMITEMVSEVLDTESTWLELISDNPDKFYVASSQKLSDIHISSIQGEKRQAISRNILQSGKPVLVNEFFKQHPLNFFTEWNENIGSLIGAPLISSTGKALGILYAVKTKSYGFDPDDLAMLEAYANQAMIALENAQLLKESLERERLEQELRIARDVQQRLLPQKLPNIKNLEVESLTITAYEVGGDYYDFIELDDQNYCVIVGDVSGKGTSAAFYMAEAKGVIQSLSQSLKRPGELLINANKILYASMEKKSFITMTAAIIDGENRTMSFSRAGHCPLLRFCGNSHQVQYLQPSGIGIGLENGKVFEKSLIEQNLPLNSGDILVFYTDGLSEARNAKNEEFGDERIGELIRLNHKKSAAQLKELLIDSILKFLDGNNLADDLTMVLIKAK